MPTEFDIIRQYFTTVTSRQDVVLGIGDDAAVINVPENMQLVQSVDTMVSGVHFPHHTSAADIAYKALAVNLSDMAAMGATPAWFTLALTLPSVDETWLNQFSESLEKLSLEYNVSLIGGDTTQGPLSISIAISGFVEKGKALTRHTARAGDYIYVSGTIGDAALALSALQGQCLLLEEYKNDLISRLNRPLPRLDISQHIIELANSCIDISDGLAADLSHVLTASKVGANIYFDDIPTSAAFNKNMTDEKLAMALVLSGGDDYELCFTIAQENHDAFKKLIVQQELAVKCIGNIINEQGLHCYDKNKQEIQIPEMGYQHFN